MAYWNWDDSYNIGIEEIDNQHKKIVEYINELHEAIILSDKNIVKNTLFHITDYIVSHFSFEEKLMKEADYPQFIHHKNIHETFVSNIGRYKIAFNEGHDIAGQLMAELQIWLTKHILQEDRAYKECVQKTLNGESENKKSNLFKKVFGSFTKQ
ncbi:MAG: bacteriohemerythrin [Campylobacteraceae bacterium]|jgi:hemerythrin|nr:bacteriohemerythrin [Campylobacteraceae bacterium]